MFWRRQTQIEQLEQRISTLSLRVAQLAQQLEDTQHAFRTTTPAALGAAIEDIRATLTVDRAALRKQLGKIWGTLGQDARRDAGQQADNGSSGDADFDAFLELQRAHGSN